MEDEAYTLRKQLRAKEADFTKTRALLEQKVELLQSEVQESKERESSLKMVVEKMCSAFKHGNNEGQLANESPHA